MGQYVMGVLLGCKMSAKSLRILTTTPNDGVNGEISLLEAYAEKFHYRDPRQAEWMGEAKGDDANVVGVWVALCGHGDDKGVPNLPSTVALAKVGSGPPYRKAKRAWAAFVAFARKHGCDLGEGQLYLAHTEVA